MKRLYLLAFASVLQLTAPAQSFIKGRVTGEGKPLAGATVSIKGNTTVFTAANDSGRFAFSRIPASSLTVEASMAGFNTSKLWLDSAALQGKEILFALTTSPLLLEPVEVRALRAGDKAPFSKTNLNKAYIEKNNLGYDIPFMLNQTPNVVVNSDAGNGVGYTGIRIRGTDATRINMTINGIPYNDAESQGLFFVNLPDFLSSVSSIQVQRGVGTSSNGAGAFGASMNFSTHEYNDKGYVELNNSYGSFNTWKNTIKAGTGLIDKKFTLDARFSTIRSDGYVDRGSSNLQSAFISGGWWGKKSSLRFNAILGKEKTYQSWYGISAADLKNNRTYNSAGTEKPGDPYENETDNYRQNHYQLFLNSTLNNGWNFNTALYLTTGSGYYEQYKANENLADYGIASINGVTETDLIRQLWLENTLLGQIFSLEQRSESSTLVLGGGWNTYNGNHFGKITWTAVDPALRKAWYDYDARKTDINLYAKYQKAIGKNWQAFADLQYRFVDYDINGFRNNPGVLVNEQYHFVNPKAGLSFNKSRWSGFFSYAMGQKEPNRDDFEAGQNQLPNPEQLHDLELNITRKNLLTGLTGSITGFYMLYRNQLVLTGQINDVGAYTRTNLPKSYRAGAEFEANYRSKFWQLNYSLSLSANKAIDFVEFMDDYDNGGQVAVNRGTTNIALSPAVVQNFSLGIKPAKDLDLTWFGKHVGEQYLDNTSDAGRKLNAFFINDLRISYTFNVGFVREIRLIAQANNLFDIKYEPNGYTFSYIYGGQTVTENYYYPMAGRNFMMALNIKL